MQEATITVAEIRAPAPGKKQWSMFDTVGGQWQVWPDKVQGFARGSTYKIAYEANEFRGKLYNTVSKSEQIGSVTGTVQLNQRVPAGGGAVVPRGPLPAGAYTPPPSDDARRQDIFICGAFNNIMGNPNVNPLVLTHDDVAALIQMLSKTWHATLGPGRPQNNSAASRAAPRDDMNDEIPFG